jgi:hypothetical protein
MEPANVPPVEPTAPPAVTPPAAQYEFTEGQNVVIGDLARKMDLVGLVLIVMGVLSLIGGIARLFGGYFEGGILGGILYILVGVWTRKAAGEFRLIVTTQGRDVSHLMRALENVRKIYDLIYVIIVVIAILVLIALVVGLVGAIVMAVSHR